MKRLSDTIALVTGASRGIGLATARRLVEEGATVVISSRKEEGLLQARESFDESLRSRVHIFPCHMGDVDAIEEMFARVHEEIGLVTVLVNNAATNPFFGPLLEVETAAWEKTFQVNVRGYFESSRQVAKACIAADKPASIIQVSSVFGLTSAPFQGVYAMTKAAVVSMTRTMAAEWGAANIRVNAICPGLVDTHFAQAIVGNDTLSRSYSQRSALNRYATPEEIAPMVAYLASEEASYVTGQAIVMDGGWLEGGG